MLKRLLLLFVMLIYSLSVYSADEYEKCLLNAIQNADDNMTISQLKSDCRTLSSVESKDYVSSESVSPVTKRLDEERMFSYNERVLTGHKPNYIIYSYNTKDPATEVFEEQFPNEDIDFDHGEIKFQISTKFLVTEDLFGNNGDVYVAYTNRSFWQANNDNISSPFRDYNHEPEAWIAFENDYELWGFKNSLISTGFVHQSNGRGGVLSRSWNRIYANFIVEKDKVQE